VFGGYSRQPRRTQDSAGVVTVNPATRCRCAARSPATGASTCAPAIWSATTSS
jgi:hypothetical protein